MKQYTDKEILEMYQQLPGDVKKAIFSVDSAEIIKKIGERYNLNIDKIGELGNETGMVMLGITHPNNFISNLAERLKVDKETAGKIGEEVNNQIFAKVRESLKKIHGINAEIPTPAGVGKEEILKEIEKDETKGETKEEVPGIIKGVTALQPFEAKTKEEVLRLPPQEKKYDSGDPYREQIG